MSLCWFSLWRMWLITIFGIMMIFCYADSLYTVALAAWCCAIFWMPFIMPCVFMWIGVMLSAFMLNAIVLSFIMLCFIVMDVIKMIVVMPSVYAEWQYFECYCAKCHLSGPPLWGRLLASPTNIRLGWKSLTGTITLVNFENPKLHSKKVLSHRPLSSYYKPFYTCNLLFNIIGRCAWCGLAFYSLRVIPIKLFRAIIY